MADRILVLTKRPAEILNEHKYCQDKTLTPLKRRERKDFGADFDILWKELNYEK